MIAVHYFKARLQSCIKYTCLFMYFLTNLCNDCCTLFQSEITVVYQVHLFVYVFLTNLCNDCCALFQSEITVVYHVHLFVYVFF